MKTKISKKFYNKVKNKYKVRDDVFHIFNHYPYSKSNVPEYIWAVYVNILYKKCKVNYAIKKDYEFAQSFRIILKYLENKND